MNGFLSFVTKAAIAVAVIEVDLIVHEWLKQAKIDTANKLSVTNEDHDDILEQLDEIRDRLQGLELG